MRVGKPRVRFPPVPLEVRLEAQESSETKLEIKEQQSSPPQSICAEGRNEQSGVARGAMAAREGLSLLIDAPATVEAMKRLFAGNAKDTVQIPPKGRVS